MRKYVSRETGRLRERERQRDEGERDREIEGERETERSREGGRKHTIIYDVLYHANKEVSQIRVRFP